MEDGALAYFDQIDRMGGMVEAIERGFPQQEIAESAYRFQQAVERREKIIVGVNDFVQDDEPPIETLYIDESAADTQLARLERLQGRRATTPRVRRALDRAARRRALDGEHHASRFSMPCARTRRSARCATRCARSGANMKKCRPFDGRHVDAECDYADARARSAASGLMTKNLESSSPSRVWTDTIGARRSLRARCVTPAWK